MNTRVKFNNRTKGLAIALLAVIVAMFTVLYSSVNVHAASVSEEQANKNLTIYVYGQMMATQYAVEGGGYLTGGDLFTGDANKGYDLNGDKFNTLSSKAQSQVVSDIAKFSNAAVDDTTTNLVKDVDESTVQNWWKTLQMKQGVGSKFLSEILKNTKPDFVTANRIWKPFAGPVGIFLGVLAVALMSLLGLSMMFDIAYIVLPPFRIFVGDKNNKDGKTPISFIISNAAIKAVEKEEGEDCTNGQAIGFYMKKQIPKLVLLGLSLMYLIAGQIYTFVGYILDLTSGFLGF